MTWIRRYKQEHLISKISADSNFTFSSYAWLCVFHCSHNYCVKLSLTEETFCENCSNFTLKWLQPNSFGEMWFLEERYEKMQKIQILKILRMPSIQSQGVYLSLQITVSGNWLIDILLRSNFGQRSDLFANTASLSNNSWNLNFTEAATVHYRLTTRSGCTFCRHLYVCTGHGNHVENTL